MADDVQQVFGLLRTDEREVLARWVDAAATSLRGRLARAELEVACRDLFTWTRV